MTEGTPMARLRAGGLPLTAFLGVCALVGTYAEIHGTARPTPPEVGGYAIAVLAAAVLHWRQRAPVVVGAAVVAVAALYHGLGYPGLAPAIALAGAVPSITALGSGVRSCVVAGVVIVAGSAVPLLPPHPTNSVWGVVGPGVLLVALAALGEATRVRRLATAEQVRALQRTAEEDARAQVVEERLRIAREVHDVLAHTITIITVQAAAAADALDERPEATRAALAAVREAARSAMAELRGTLALLRTGSDPVPLAPQPGLAQLPLLVEQARAGGLAVTVTTTGRVDLLPDGVERAVHRIVQEALTNTLRHSRSTTATVAITAGTDAVTVDVTDDGPALHPEPHVGGHGLVGMAERVQALGGTLDAGPAPPPSSGFRIAARIPAGSAR
ncbi:sensor histidine kinase [Pseudonocardia sp. CA-107938]|uniref:sensor histidine kinase n=1 Tax=Pseudonocardia sp. CA-107938 TaxID=3240021 RepID=UPI003D8A23D0